MTDLVKASLSLLSLRRPEKTGQALRILEALMNADQRQEMKGMQDAAKDLAIAVKTTAHLAEDAPIEVLEAMADQIAARKKELLRRMRP